MEFLRNDMLCFKISINVCSDNYYYLKIEFNIIVGKFTYVVFIAYTYPYFNNYYDLTSEL